MVKLMTTMLPGMVTMLPTYMIYSRLGLINTHAALWIGAFCGGRLAGFVRCVGDGEHVLLVQDLIVDRAFRGRDIGKTLFSSVAARFSGARMFCVFTDIGDARACAFYRSFGMEPIDSGNMIAFFRKRSS